MLIIIVHLFILEKGMATNFIIQWAIERGGVFPKEDVATLIAVWQGGQSHLGHGPCT